MNIVSVTVITVHNIVRHVLEFRDYIFTVISNDRPMIRFEAGEIDEIMLTLWALC
jgi:hypothetical protein